MSTCPGLKSKISFHGLDEKVADWIFKDKLSYVAISEKLLKEYGIEISSASISNFKKFVIDTVPEFLEEDKDYRTKLAKKYLDTVENLIFALDKIKEKIEKFDDVKHWRQQSTYLGLMMGELNMLLKRAGEIKPAQFIEKQEVNMVVINQMVQMELVRMIDEGKIPLAACDGEIKEFYRKIKNAVVI